MKAAAVFVLLLLFGACASAPPSEVLATNGHWVINSSLPGGLEAIYGVSATKDALRVRVSSNGCTQKTDFLVTAGAIPKAPPGAIHISLVRTRLDSCQSFAIGSTYLDFSYSDLGVLPGSELKLLNPLTPWNGPGD